MILLACTGLIFSGCSSGRQDFFRGEQLAEAKETTEAIEAYLAAAASGYQPVQTYFRIAQLFEDSLNEPEIALWYYKRAFAASNTTDSLRNTILLRLGNIESKIDQKKDIAHDTKQRLQEQEKVIALLEERCEDLSKWVKRLSDENLTLRQLLIEKQEKK